MKRIFPIIACCGALLLAACTGDSKLPEPTGKGAVRAINAMPGSPYVDFLIEETSLGGITYKASSQPSSFDDFEYNFNFDIDVPNSTEPLRIATVTTQVEVDREHVFVLTGDVDNPVVTTWTTDEREWSGTETVFESRFAHLSVTLGDIDVFFQDPAEPVVAGGHVARLSYGDVMDFADFEAGTYVITVTAADDVTTLHYASSEVAFAAQTSITAGLFDGNENDTSPFVIGSMSSAGQALRLADPAYPSTVRFIHGAATLETVDVYRDEALTELVTSNVVFGVPTSDIEVLPEDTTFYFTPTGSTATTLFTQIVGIPEISAATELFMIGDTDAWSGINFITDRSSSSNIVKLSIFSSAFNNSLFEVFVVDRGEEIASDALPVLTRVAYGSPSSVGVLDAGSYDLYITAVGTRDPISAAFPLDVALGDIVQLMVTDDSADPEAALVFDVTAP